MQGLDKHIEKIFKENYADESDFAVEVPKVVEQLLTLFADGTDKAEFELLTLLLKSADGGNDLRSLIEGQLQSERFKKKFIQKGVGK